jgi:hypothetical protein
MRLKQILPHHTLSCRSTTSPPPPTPQSPTLPPTPRSAAPRSASPPTPPRTPAPNPHRSPPIAPSGTPKPGAAPRSARPLPPRVTPYPHWCSLNQCSAESSPGTSAPASASTDIRPTPPSIANSYPHPHRVRALLHALRDPRLRVRLVVQPPRHRRHKPARHQLPHEHHAPLLSTSLPHIKPQVDLREVHIPRPFHPQHPRVQKPEPHQTAHRPTLKQVQFQTRWQPLLQQRRLHRVTRDDQVPPLRRQEGPRHPQAYGPANDPPCSHAC